MNYIKRSLRCFLKLAVLVGVVFGALHLLGMLDLGKWRVNGPVLGAVMVAWAAVYPLTSFMVTSVRMAMERERLINTFASLDYVLVEENKGVAGAERADLPEAAKGGAEVLVVENKGVAGAERADLPEAAKGGGEVLVVENMVFRARSVLRRILWNFDDAVTVTRDGGFIDIEGTKRIVPRVASRIDNG